MLTFAEKTSGFDFSGHGVIPYQAMGLDG